jgi:TRAP-type C4-dicarboxylate transport system substrate-binding protein
MRDSDVKNEIERMTTRIVTDSNGRKHITTEPLLHPSQRAWVGLTEREQGAIMEDLNAYGTNLYQFAEAIEAKLKEKNT